MVLSTARKNLRKRSPLYKQTLRRAQGNNVAVGLRSNKGASLSHTKSKNTLPDAENEPPTKAALKKKPTTRAPPTKANRKPEGNPPKLFKIERKTPPRDIRLGHCKNPARARGPLQDTKDNNKEAGLSENGDSQTESQGNPSLTGKEQRGSKSEGRGTTSDVPRDSPISVKGKSKPLICF